MEAKIKDVARLAGVSTAIVSRILANEGYVSEETRKSVLATMERLHYQPEQVARSLRVQRSSSIGLLISDIQNPFFISLVRAVEDIALQHQYAVILCNADEDSEKEKFYLATELLFQRIADPLRPIQQVTIHNTLHIRESCGAHPDDSSSTRHSASSSDIPELASQQERGTA